MRWEKLFDDLESQLETELDAEEHDVRGEEERLRLARLTLRDRLRAMHAAEHALRLALVDGRSVAIRPRGIGRDWVTGELVDDAGRPRQGIVPLEAIASIVLDAAGVESSVAESSDPAPTISGRLTLAFALRDLARRRVHVELHTRSGPLRGTIDRVGLDHVDLAEHEAGTARRDSAIASVRVVPFAQLVLVRL